MRDKIPGVVIDQFELKRQCGTYQMTIVSVNLSLKSLQDSLSTFLHPQEQDYAHTLKVPNVLHRYLLGRYAAKIAISEHTNYKNLGDMLVLPGVFEQPVLKLPFPANLQVSISHSGALGVAIIFPEAHPAGLDLEMFTGQYTSIEEIITPTDRQLLSLLLTNPAESDLLLLTMKESLSKVVRTGLMTSFAMLFEIAGTELSGGFLNSTYSHFPQYQCISWISDRYACSIALPRKSRLNQARLHRFFTDTDNLLLATSGKDR